MEIILMYNHKQNPIYLTKNVFYTFSSGFKETLFI